MLTPAARRLIFVSLSLVGAVLACERAEVSIAPATPLFSTPLPPAFTLGAPTPTPTLPPDTPTATVEIAATTAATEAPTPTVADTPTTEAPTEAPTATSLQPTPTQPPSPVPTATPVLPTATPPPAGSNPTGIPSNATLTQKFTISNEGGTVFGRPQDMADNRTETWASLRGGNSAWIFDLGSPQRVVGVRLYAHRDGNEDTTLVGIDVSADGSNWTTAFTASGNCGMPNCDILPPDTFIEIGLAPSSAQFVRLRSGPTRFAFAEVQIAVLP